MSIELIAPIIEARRAPWKHNELLVLLMLGNYGEPDGTKIFPKVETLARTCRLSVRATQIVLRKLEQDGILICVRRASGAPGQFTEYRINMSRLQDMQGCKICRGAVCGDEGCRSKHQGVQNRASHIEDPSLTRPKIRPESGALAPKARAALDRWNGYAPQIMQALGPVRFTKFLSNANPVFIDNRIMLGFPSSFEADRFRAELNALATTMEAILGITCSITPAEVGTKRKHAA